jgi:hypothetical protein
VAVMRNIIFWLIFLVLAFGYSISYAEEVTYKGMYPEIKKSSFTSNAPESNKDDLETQLIVYSLIIGIYTLYWFKQKA